MRFTYGNHDHALPELRHTKPTGLDDSLLDRVPKALKFEYGAAQNEHLPIQDHVRNVLHHDSTWLGKSHDLKE